MHLYVDGIITPRKRRNSDANPDLSPTLDITTITYWVPCSQHVSARQIQSVLAIRPLPSLGEISAKALIAKTKESHG